MNNLDKLTARKRGFTLLETMVAVTILALAVAGPIYVADRVLVATQVAKEQLTASYLAQEGVEYVRSMRDREFLIAYATGSGTASDDAWTTFISGDSSHPGSIARCTSLAPTCALNPFAAGGMGYGGNHTIVNCPGACPLYVTGSGQYTLSNTGATLTPYTRKIWTILVSPNNLKIVSTVTWSDRGSPFTVTVVSHVTPWQ